MEPNDLMEEGVDLAEFNHQEELEAQYKRLIEGRDERSYLEIHFDSRYTTPGMLEIYWNEPRLMSMYLLGQLDFCTDDKVRDEIFFLFDINRSKYEWN